MFCSFPTYIDIYHICLSVVECIVYIHRRHSFLWCIVCKICIHLGDILNLVFLLPNFYIFENSFCANIIVLAEVFYRFSVFCPYNVYMPQQGLPCSIYFCHLIMSWLLRLTLHIFIVDRSVLGDCFQQMSSEYSLSNYMLISRPKYFSLMYHFMFQPKIYKRKHIGTTKRKLSTTRFCCDRSTTVIGKNWLVLYFF